MRWQNLDIVPKNSGFTYWTERHFITREWFRNYVNDFDLWLFTEGSGMLRDPQGRIWPLKRGSIVLLRPGWICEAWQEPGAEPIGTFWFHMDLACSKGGGVLTAEEVDFLPFYYETYDIAFFEGAARKIVELLRNRWHEDTPKNRHERFQAGLLIKSMLMEMERESQQSSENKPRGIQLHYKQLFTKLVADISARPEAFESSRQLARLCGYSTDHFTRTFRRIIGRSPTEVLIDARIDKAKDLLAFSDLAVGEIAERLGYHNIYFFSRQFRQRAGLSPAAFRDRLSSGAAV